MSLRGWAFGALLIGMGPWMLWAQNAPPRAPGGRPPMRGAPPQLDFATAQKAMEAAQAAAAAAGLRVAIAIVDANGDLVELIRRDGAPSLGVTTAEGKARAAILFGMPTRLVQQAIVSGKPLQVQHVTAPRLGATELTPMQGGIPILKDGKVIGGIGVGGSAPATDEKVAEAGAQAVSEQ